MISIKLEDNNKETARKAIQTLEELGYQNDEEWNKHIFDLDLVNLHLLIIGNTASLHNHSGEDDYSQFNSLEEFLENKV